MKYVEKLPLAVLTVALHCELGNRASIPVDFAAPAAFHRARGAGKHARTAATVPATWQTIHSKQSIRLFFPVYCELSVNRWL